MKNFLRGVEILHRWYVRKQWLCIQYVPDILSGGEKVFPEGRSPTLSYGPGHQLIKYAEITL